jgi:hypothetical protein
VLEGLAGLRAGRRAAVAQAPVGLHRAAVCAQDLHPCVLGSTAAGPGRRAAAAAGGESVQEGLGEQSEAFGKRIEIVVIDPSSPYASRIAAA